MALACLGDAPTTREPAERPDLAPLPQRWMRYPAEVSSVCFDRQRRAWFTLAKRTSAEEVKRQVERSEDLAVPWVEGIRIFLFDSAGRIWFSPRRQVLMGYDPRAHQWIERLAVGFKVPGDEGANREHHFTGAMLEDSQGRIFAADQSGCHIYDNGVWTYQPLDDANVAYASSGLPEPEHGPIGLTRDEQGRVYAWEITGRPGGFAGCQVHHKDGWKQILAAEGNPPGRIVAVVPLRGSRVLVCPARSPAFILPVADDPEQEKNQVRDDIALLGNEVFATREAAERRLITHGDDAIAELNAALAKAPPPEVRMRIGRVIKAIGRPGANVQLDGHSLVVTRAIFHEGIGDAYLWSRLGIDPADARKTEVWHVDPDGHIAPAPNGFAENLPNGGLAADSRGLFSAGQSLLLLKDGKCTALTDVFDGPIQKLYGIDRLGRIYLRTYGGVIGIDPAAPEIRPTLPINSYPVFAGGVCMTATGKICAKLTGPDHGFLSLYENGHWTELPVPPNEQDFMGFSYIQPLRDGGLIAKQRGHVLLLEDGHWSVFDDIRNLVEAKAELLVKQLDNSLPGLEDQCRIRLDARHAIWCADNRSLGVWAQGHWLPEADAQIVTPLRDCLPVFGGRLMLLYNREGRAALARIQSGAVTSSPYPAAASLPISWYQNIHNLDVDSTGRCFIPRRDDSVLLFEATGFRVLPDIGLPRLDDAAHRIWFVDPQRHVLTALSRDGARAEFHDASLSEQCAIVEDKDHTYWAYTPRGLVHLSLAHDQLIEAFGPVYSRGIPSLGLCGMWMDPNRILWLSTPDRLYRVQLP
jgi:hypothetical protein